MSGTASFAPFPPEFVDLLHAVLARAPRLRDVVVEMRRSRRKIMTPGGTFAGHRAYAPGEDLRFLDWNAYARSGALVLKVLEEDQHRALSLLVDRSRSMATGTPERRVAALRLAALLGGLGLVQLDAVHVADPAGRTHTIQGARSLPRLLDLLRDAEFDDRPPDVAWRKVLQRGLPGRVHWISDFADPEAAVPLLVHARRSGRALSGWLPVLPEDHQPVLDGWLVLVDPETSAELRIQVDASLRAAMAEEVRALARHQDAVFGAAGYVLHRYPVPSPGDYRLASWWGSVWNSRS